MQKDIAEPDKIEFVSSALIEIEANKNKRLIAMALLQNGGMTYDDYCSIEHTGIFPLMMAFVILPYVGAVDMALIAYDRYASGEYDEKDCIDTFSCLIAAYHHGLNCNGGNKVFDWTAMDTRPKPVHHPDDPSLVFSGYGKRPNWLVDYLKQGGKYEELAAA